jgi:hypothetical protein
MKRIKFPSFVVTRLELEDNMLSERSQTQKDKGCMFSVICESTRRSCKLAPKLISPPNLLPKNLENLVLSRTQLGLEDCLMLF